MYRSGREVAVMFIIKYQQPHLWCTCMCVQMPNALCTSSHLILKISSQKLIHIFLVETFKLILESSFAFLQLSVTSKADL